MIISSFHKNFNSGSIDAVMTEEINKNNAGGESTEEKKVVVEDEWLIRPCKTYEEEYSDCCSLKARFHQYFVFGKYTDCTQWKRDCDNCYRWTEQKNVKSAEEIVASEKARRITRLSSHYGNNVWQKRKIPPENWNSPLPDFLLEEYEHSYLNLKAKEMKGGAPSSIDPGSYCVLM